MSMAAKILNYLYNKENKVFVSGKMVVIDDKKKEVLIYFLFKMNI